MKHQSTIPLESGGATGPPKSKACQVSAEGGTGSEVWKVIYDAHGLLQEYQFWCFIIKSACEFTSYYSKILL